jgi:HEAT repeat protein
VAAAIWLEEADLGSIERALPALAAGLRDPSWEVRLHCSEALKRLGPRARYAAPALASALGDEYAAVRHNAKAALASIGAPAVPALLRELKEGREGARFATAGVFGALGPAAKQAVPALLDTARSDVPDVRLEAAHALVRIAPADPVVLRVAVPLLVGGLRDEAPDLRLRAGGGLARVGEAGKPAVPVLVALLWHPRYRGMAALHLWRMGPPAKAALPALHKVFAVKEEDPAVRTLTAGAALRIDPSDKGAADTLAGLVPVLVLGVEGRGGDDLTLFAADTLGRLGARAKKALPALRGASRRGRPELREAAERAIRQIQSDRGAGKG